jgi:hypothetical protein
LAASDGKHAVKSGVIDHSQESVLGVRLEGAGVLSFDWRSSCEEKYDAVRLEIDGVNVRAISGVTEWMNVKIELGDGQHDVRWIYKKGRSKTEGEDAVWVDRVVWVPVPKPTLSEAIGVFNWETDGDVLWQAVRSESAYDDGMCASVENLDDYGCSTVCTYVTGPGRLVFRWSVSCEDSYDWLAFIVDGEVFDMITGEKGWTEVSVELGDGVHTLEWEYWKDEMDDPALSGDNLARLDGVEWESSAPLQTTTTGVPVPFEVIRTTYSNYLHKAGGDYEAAAHSVGKNGRPIWESYLIGLDSENPDDKDFVAKIQIVDGKPIVTWSPDLNQNGKEKVRLYKTFGTECLGDSELWVDMDGVSDSSRTLFKFFKVTVGLP